MKTVKAASRDRPATGEQRSRHLHGPRAFCYGVPKIFRNGAK
jgi:hypothetical protein